MPEERKLSNGALDDAHYIAALPFGIAMSSGKLRSLLTVILQLFEG